VYVSYKLKNTSDTGGTWTGQGRGISPEGNLARGNLQVFGHEMEKFSLLNL
jgi:DNA-binding protein H-NS